MYFIYTSSTDTNLSGPCRHRGYPQSAACIVRSVTTSSMITKTSTTKDVITTTTTTVTSPKTRSAITPTKCPKCGLSPKGNPSCCGHGGAWRGKCGDDAENNEHTWSEGVEACLRKSMRILPGVIMTHYFYFTHCYLHSHNSRRSGYYLYNRYVPQVRHK